MIDHLDTLLHRLFRDSIAELTSDAQVRFQPPDEDWRALVPTITDAAGNPANSLNVYLADLRENRKLRSNARERTVVDREVFETPPARRVDCHYLISAWSPVAASIAHRADTRRARPARRSGARARRARPARPGGDLRAHRIRPKSPPAAARG